tara:strand:+ start:9935 stop:10903 length:969 start_codon:yes stop_codon:yes gene_type:complete
MNLKGSVCIAAHNEAPTISAIIESCMQYDSPLVDEILICDSASTDNTAQVVEQFAERDSRIQLLTSELGKPNACNMLIERARNDALFFFDADVVLGENCIRNLAVTLESESYIAVAAKMMPYSAFVGKFPSIKELIGMPIGNNLLVGRGYAMRKSTIMEKMRTYRYNEIPTDVLHEDLWINALVSADEFTMCKEATVYYDIGTIADYAKSVARGNVAKEQLAKDHFEIYDNFLKEHFAQGSRLKRYIQKFGEIEGTADLMCSIVRFPLRKSILFAYRNIMKRHENKMRKELQEKGGHIVLSQSGRLDSTKKAFETNPQKRYQ